MKIYIPVIGPKIGNGFWSTVNGGHDPDRDEAIRKSSRHTAVTSGECEIKRIDEQEVDEAEYYSPKPY